MRKNIFIILFVMLCFFTIANAQYNGCNSSMPGWGDSLGAITRGNEWTVSGNGITQIWSDAVTAAGCNKSNFSGGSKGSYNADCRSNPDYPGDLFSWCAVVRFKDQLCPAPWRVPTMQDFIDLNKALGGTGEDGEGNVDKYINSWGSAYSGFCSESGAMDTHGMFAFYWAQTETSVDNGYKLHLFSSGQIYSQGSYDKNAGFTLRCVR